MNTATDFRGIEGDQLPPRARSPTKAAHTAEIFVNGLRKFSVKPQNHKEEHTAPIAAAARDAHGTTLAEDRERDW